MESYNKESFPIKREQTVLDSEYIPVGEEKPSAKESPDEQAHIRSVAASIYERRTKQGNQRDAAYIDKILAKNGITSFTPEAEEFMRTWDWEAAKNIIHSGKLRDEAYADIAIVFGGRLEHDLYATPDELSAGVYKEQLEPQVNDAVMVLRGKGYDTFESGFSDPYVGGQYMGFQKIEGESLIVDVEDLRQKLEGKGIAVEFRESDDRYTLSLIPSDKISLQDWKEIWDTVASSLPDRERSATPSHTGASILFREQQEKLRSGGDAYLGGDYFFKDGKVIKKER